DATLEASGTEMSRPDLRESPWAITVPAAAAGATTQAAETIPPARGGGCNGSGLQPLVAPEDKAGAILGGQKPHPPGALAISAPAQSEIVAISNCSALATDEDQAAAWGEERGGSSRELRDAAERPRVIAAADGLMPEVVFGEIPFYADGGDLEIHPLECE